MHMGVVAAPWPDAAEPGRAGLRAAEFPLDRVVDQHPVHDRRLRRQSDQRGVPRPPTGPRNAGLVRQHQGRHVDVLPRGDGRVLLRRQVEPDVDVQAGLVAGMAVGHRPAPRLRHVADPKRGQAARPRGAGEIPHEAEQGWVSPVSVPGQAHGLPPRPVWRQGVRPRHAAERWTADNPGWPGCRPGHRRPRCAGAGRGDRRPGRGGRSKAGPFALRLLPFGRRRRGAAGPEEQGDGGCGTNQKRRSKTVTTSPGCNKASRLARYSTGRPSSLMRVMDT
jgi:hypothetical protein